MCCRNSLFFNVWFCGVCFFVGFYTIQCNQVKQAITVDTTRIVEQVSDKFLSVAFTIGLVQEHWIHFDFSSSRIFTLARSLAPAYVRFGGTAEDWLHFVDKPYKPYKPLTTVSPLQHKNFTDYNITSDDLDKIHLIASKAGWQVLFGLNVCLRTQDGTWNYTNPLKIMQYVANKGYDFGWELGNGKDMMGMCGGVRSGKKNGKKIPRRMPK
ncbi:hypothetical protein QZH41_000070 [Actinostola sp. cb2023]|nr:hypothetical protein QZH41_000070 [Actinostola sp. cb2023]